MFGLEDWIVKPRFFKTYFSLGSRFAGAKARVALETRSERLLWQDRLRRNAFSAFAWKI